ncbi:MAG: hypothetical protein S4CHLAM102_11620 [Chlamydiia bacterium]|nr:hypothetical protein [Chlamydiia bacterium]
MAIRVGDRIELAGAGLSVEKEPGTSTDAGAGADVDGVLAVDQVAGKVIGSEVLEHIKPLSDEVSRLLLSVFSRTVFDQEVNEARANQTLTTLLLAIQKSQKGYTEVEMIEVIGLTFISNLPTHKFPINHFTFLKACADRVQEDEREGVYGAWYQHFGIVLSTAKEFSSLDVKECIREMRMELVASNFVLAPYTEGCEVRPLSDFLDEKGQFSPEKVRSELCESPAEVYHLARNSRTEQLQKLLDGIAESIVCGAWEVDWTNVVEVPLILYARAVHGELSRRQVPLTQKEVIVSQIVALFKIEEHSERLDRVRELVVGIPKEGEMGRWARIATCQSLLKLLSGHFPHLSQVVGEFSGLIDPSINIPDPLGAVMQASTSLASAIELENMLIGLEIFALYGQVKKDERFNRVMGLIKLIYNGYLEDEPLDKAICDIIFMVCSRLQGRYSQEGIEIPQLAHERIPEVLDSEPGKQIPFRVTSLNLFMGGYRPSDEIPIYLRLCQVATQFVQYKEMQESFEFLLICLALPRPSIHRDSYKGCLRKLLPLTRTPEEKGRVANCLEVVFERARVEQWEDMVLCTLAVNVIGLEEKLLKHMGYALYLRLQSLLSEKAREWEQRGGVKRATRLRVQERIVTTEVERVCEECSLDPSIFHWSIKMCLIGRDGDRTDCRASVEKLLGGGEGITPLGLSIISSASEHIFQTLPAAWDEVSKDFLVLQLFRIVSGESDYPLLAGVCKLLSYRDLAYSRLDKRKLQALHLESNFWSSLASTQKEINDKQNCVVDIHAFVRIAYDSLAERNGFGPLHGEMLTSMNVYDFVTLHPDHPSKLSQFLLEMDEAHPFSEGVAGSPPMASPLSQASTKGDSPVLEEKAAAGNPKKRNRRKRAGGASKSPPAATRPEKKEDPFERMSQKPGEYGLLDYPLETRSQVEKQQISAALDLNYRPFVRDPSLDEQLEFAHQHTPFVPRRMLTAKCQALDSANEALHLAQDEIQQAMRVSSSLEGRVKSLEEALVQERAAAASYQNRVRTLEEKDHKTRMRARAAEEENALLKEKVGRLEVALEQSPDTAHLYCPIHGDYPRVPVAITEEGARILGFSLDVSEHGILFDKEATLLRMEEKVGRKVDEEAVFVEARVEKLQELISVKKKESALAPPKKARKTADTSFICSQLLDLQKQMQPKRGGHAKEILEGIEELLLKFDDEIPPSQLVFVVREAAPLVHTLLEQIVKMQLVAHGVSLRDEVFDGQKVSMASSHRVSSLLERLQETHEKKSQELADGINNLNVDALDMRYAPGPDESPTSLKSILHGLKRVNRRILSLDSDLRAQAEMQAQDVYQWLSNTLTLACVCLSVLK